MTQHVEVPPSNARKTGRMIRFNRSPKQPSQRLGVVYKSHNAGCFPLPKVRSTVGGTVERVTAITYSENLGLLELRAITDLL